MSSVPACFTRFSQVSAKTYVFALLAVGVLLLSGCGMVSNLMHAAGVDMIPAECTTLEEMTVAIVTVTDSSQYSDDVTARELSRRVGEVLTKKVDKVILIREDKIEEWRDVNGWDKLDFLAIGKGVNADKVLGIEVSNMGLRDGATLYRGRSDVRIVVIDVENEGEEYRRSLDEYTFPSVAGQYTSETTESKFRKLYLSMLAKEIGRSFHPYDMTDRFALDSAIASH
jgi:hypothetical protein